MSDNQTTTTYYPVDLFAEVTNGIYWNLTMTASPEVYAEALSTIQLVIHIVRTIVGIFGLVSNALVIYVVLKFAAMKTYSNKLLASLAVADVLLLINDLIGLIIVPLFDWEFPCQVKMIGNTLTAVSGFHLALIVCDRFIFIHFPFAYARNMRFFIWPFLVASWLPATILISLTNAFLCCSNIVNNNIAYHTINCILFLSLLLLVTVMYVMIFVTALRHRRAIKMSLRNPSFNCGVDNPQHSLEKLKEEFRILLGYLLVGLSVFLTWGVPTFFYMGLTIQQEYFYQHQNFTYIMYYTLGVILTFNSSTNPLIYAFTQRPFKENFKRVLTSISKSFRVTCMQYCRCSWVQKQVQSRRNHRASSTATNRTQSCSAETTMLAPFNSKIKLSPAINENQCTKNNIQNNCIENDVEA